jgi:hypothetical protein
VVTPTRRSSIKKYHHRTTETSTYRATPEKEAITMAKDIDLLTAARAEALFTSCLSAGTRPAPGEVAEAIRAAMRAYGGSRGCAAEVAAAYGERPETAAPRMRWALGVVSATYPPRPHRLVPRPAAPSRSERVAASTSAGRQTVAA